MAHYRAIAAALAAIEGLLDERYPRDEEGFSGSLDIRRIQPKDIETLSASGPAGIAILLWRVTINQQRRMLPPRTDLFGRRFKSSIPIDLSILLIPFAASAEVQHRILGWTMRALADAGPLKAAQLNQYLKEDDVFADTEELDLVCDPLPVPDYLSLWDRLKKHPLAVNYLVRMVLLDSADELVEAPAVVEREFVVGSAVP
ncbi:MAG: Pvc16 family protein [Novosphingobium sp.]